MSNAQNAWAHKKSRPKPGGSNLLEIRHASAQSNIAGNGQKQDASFVENKRKPGLVVELIHEVSDSAAISLFYHHDIMIAEKEAKIKKKRLSVTVKAVIGDTYGMPQSQVFPPHRVAPCQRERTAAHALVFEASLAAIARRKGSGDSIRAREEQVEDNFSYEEVFLDPETKGG